MKKIAWSVAVGFALIVPCASLGADTEKTESKEWVVTTRAVGRPSRGSNSQLEVQVTARGGFHLNDDYPLNFKPKASAAANFARAQVGRSDGMTFEPCAADKAHQCTVRIPVSFTPNALGEVKLQGTVAFSVCNPDLCLIKKVDLTIPVQVQS